ncbi:MAG: T9SS type A sorting domain-containing protein [Ekhidna sp.]|uniref:T9SS type A sorting domain-containing protein n=1 Tax=Ekhidna sp. TaxID=2608089 RepID=UPI0032EFD061
MKTKTRMLTLAAVLSLGMSAFAQSDEGKIVVEITKEINGEKKTFKGEYNSAEEMRADPSYQEFAGEQEGFNFWFGDTDDHDVFLHLDQMKDRNKSFFKYFHGDDEDDEGGFFFKHFDGDSVDGFFDLRFDGADMEELRERMKELGMDMQIMMDRFDDEDHQMHVIEIKRVKVTDVGDEEFGKKGKVDESNLLELDDLRFYPNPSSNGRIKVRFSVPDEDELNIRVSNLEGKEVFSRNFDRFSGTYSELIDLSGQKEGIYLLEISQGKKRLTKKIVIN